LTPYPREETKSVVEILHNPEIKTYKLQMTYFSCYDIDGGINLQDRETNVFKDAGTTINRLIESLAIIDRAKGVELLRAIAGKDTMIKHKHYPHLNATELSAILKEILEYKHYFLNLYPHGSPTINMLSFTGEEIVRKMDEISKEYGALLWYIP
jgi:hypothetical protein